MVVEGKMQWKWMGGNGDWVVAGVALLPEAGSEGTEDGWDVH